MFGAYLFDLDGTLIDTTALISSAFDHTLRAHGCPIPSADTLREGFGIPLRTHLAELARDPADVEAMIVTYRTYHGVHHDEMVRQYPGIREAVSTLRSRAVKLGIVTSKGRRAAERGLRRCGLDGYFDVLISVDDVTEHKPHPAPVVAALDRLTVTAAEAVFIGDSPHDMQSGREAGVRTAAALWGFFPASRLTSHRPDFWLNEPHEIERLIG